MHNKFFKNDKIGYTVLETLSILMIIMLITTVVLVGLDKIRVRMRDAKRLADVQDIQAALAIYKNETGAYPASLVPGQALISPSGKVLMEQTPIAPSNKDGDCSSNSYVYTLLSGGRSYNLNYCLGAKSGDYGPNECVATPKSICDKNYLAEDTGMKAGGGPCVPDCSGKCGGQPSNCNTPCNAPCTGKSWMPMPAFYSTGRIFDIALDRDEENMPNLAVLNGQNGYTVDVVRFNNSILETVKDSGFGHGDIGYLTFAYNDSLKRSSVVEVINGDGRMASYNSSSYDSRWKNVGQDPFAFQNSTDPDLSWYNDMWYLAYHSGEKSKKIVVEERQDDNDFNPICNSANGVGEDEANKPKIKAVDNDHLYLGYIEKSRNDKVTLMRCEGHNDFQPMVDFGEASANDQVTDFDMDFNPNDPQNIFVATVSRCSGNGGLSLRSYSIGGNSWSDLGHICEIDDQVSAVDLAMSSADIYAAIVNRGQYVTVLKFDFNTNAWQPLGDALTGTSFIKPKIAIINNEPWVCAIDSAADYKVYCAVYR